MLIAVASDGRDLDSPVSGTLETCRSLLIVNMETGEIQSHENSGDPSGLLLAGIIVEKDCEAVISGGLGPAAFDLIADACVTRYDGSGLSAREALLLMDQNRLGFLNPDTEICHSHHESACGGCGH